VATVAKGPWHDIERLRKRLVGPDPARGTFTSGKVSEQAMNAALSMIEAAAPKDEIEAALAIQMSCTHAAAMSLLARLDAPFVSERRVAAFGSAASRLLRAFAMQVEVLRRLRHGGHQHVRVEHVHINDGGQAVIGNVKAGSDGERSNGDRP
jgi:hypothetical protein